MSASFHTTLRPVDAHVHGSVDRSRVLALRCLPLQEAAREVRSDSGPVCSGLHPWDVTLDSWENDLAMLDQLLEAGKIQAVGEAGLDRSRGPDPALQRRAFVAQILLSERHKLPLVVHSVRAGSDLLELATAMRPRRPWILHDWNGPPEQALALIAKSDSVYSFGANLMRGAPGARDSAVRVPLERVLIETDDSQWDILEIERTLAAIRGMAPEDLRAALHRTWARLFGDSGL